MENFYISHGTPVEEREDYCVLYLKGDASV